MVLVETLAFLKISFAQVFGFASTSVAFCLFVRQRSCGFLLRSSNQFFELALIPFHSVLSIKIFRHDTSPLSVTSARICPFAKSAFPASIPRRQARSIVLALSSDFSSRNPQSTDSPARYAVLELAEISSHFYRLVAARPALQ